MKYLIIGVSMLLTLGGALHAQDDNLNLAKYWKLRNDFREYFIKIGSEAGASIPARALIPGGCIDNQPGCNGETYGMMHWGDATIRLGHYLTVLASEYRLLKNGNKDITGVKNELYYALNAINRLDLNAENNLGNNYGLTINGELNGYFLREDVGEDFATNNWGNTKFKMRCTNSDFYYNDNVLKENGLFSNCPFDGNGVPMLGKVAQNSIRNIPSADQVQSLLLGLSMIYELVDNDQAPMDPSFYLIDETKNITDRLVGFINDHNWQLIDVNGWPVNNMGGDYLLLSYPTSLAANRITGNIYLNNITRRMQSLDLNLVMTCMTGIGSDDDISQNQACDNIAFYEALAVAASAVSGGGSLGFIQHAYPFIARTEIEPLEVAMSNINSQDQSAFQTWQYMIGPTAVNNFPAILNFPIAALDPIWSNAVMQDVQTILVDLEDNGKLDNAPLIAFPFNTIELTKKEGRSYTRKIIFETGVISGKWSSTTAGAWGDYTNNRELELANYVLFNQTPTHDKNFYRSYLDGMSSDGPYNLKYQAGNSTMAIMSSSNGWGSDYKWGNSVANGGAEAELGIFSGLDYLVYHNLYYLLYQNQLPPFEETDICFNNPEPHLNYDPNANPDYIAAANLVNEKTHFIPHKTVNIFDPVQNLVNDNFYIEPQFLSYIDYKIFPTKHQTEDVIIDKGVVYAKTRFLICPDNLLTINPLGTLSVEYSTTFVDRTSVIDCSGKIIIKPGATLHIKNGGKLILRANSQLIIEDGGKLIIDQDATVEYYNTAQIRTKGAGSEIVHRGHIITMNPSAFKIWTDGTAAGKLYIESYLGGFEANAASTFTLNGKGINDPFIVIREVGNLHIIDPEITSFTINSCKVEFKNTTELISFAPFYATSTHFFSSANNDGIYFTDKNTFTSCNFTEVPVRAALNIENNGQFNATYCNFTATNSLLNTPYTALVTVLGRTLNVSNCVFTGNRNACLKTSNMTMTANVTSSTFTSSGTSPSTTLIGIDDVSDIEYYLNSNGFNKCYQGLKKSTGKVSFKCNGFSNNRDLNVYAMSGCDLNFSSGTTAGSNQLLASLTNKNIRVVNSNIVLSGGKNHIQQCTNTIYGTLESSCTAPCPALNYSNNQWGVNGGTVPSSSSFQIYYANGPSMVPVTTPTIAYLACSTGGGGLSGRSENNNSYLPKIFSVIEQDSIAIDIQLENALQLMSSYADSTDKSNDLKAVKLLNELFTANNLNYDDSETNALLWQAYDNMKMALESAFDNEQISLEDNVSSFEKHVAMFANAQMKLSSTKITEANFYKQYYHEIDKAHLFRLIGHTSIGLNILKELENCGIDSLTQAHLNYWKTQFEEEIALQAIGLNAVDTTIEVDTKSYFKPALAINNYSFGAVIYDLQNIVFPNCGLFQTAELMDYMNADITVYPNPSSSNVSIRLNAKYISGNGKLVIQQLDGKVIVDKNVEFDSQFEIDQDVSNWAKGVYQVTLKMYNGNEFKSRFIVN